MTIQYRCDGCGQVRLGMREQVFVPGHIVIKAASNDYLGHLKIGDVRPYYICENCKDYGKQKYIEDDMFETVN